MANQETRKCAHIPCLCDVPPGKNYCGDSCRDAGSNELMTIRHEVVTAEGERVCEAINTIVSRGTASGRAS